MISEKYFLKWIREAGRGHIVAFLSWGSMVSYVLIKVLQLSMSTEYNFFGIGSRELLWICAGLGFALSQLEFFYLLQPRKLDFYYSLPVKKSTIFWSRYVHGLLHFMIPFCLAVIACGMFESSIDLDFFPYSASYTGYSILVFGMIFLIFYHVGILMNTICGNILPVILGYAVCLFYGHVLAGNVFPTWAENYFRTYYRIPLFEKLDIILSPFSLAGQMTVGNLFDKRAVFEYVPSGLYIEATFGWIILPFLLFAVAQKRRKAERVGKIFVLPLAERAAEFLLSFLAGVWSGSLFVDLSGLAAEHLAACASASILTGVFVALAVHFLMEWGVGSGRTKSFVCETRACGGRIATSTSYAAVRIPPEGFYSIGKFGEVSYRIKNIFRRKWQLGGECAAIVLVGAVFVASASSFDSFLPKESKVEKIGISVAGLGMNHGEQYETVGQLEKYVLAEDGKSAAGAWIASLVEKSNFAVPGDTYAAVCYHMRNGAEVYRLYPVDTEDFWAFSFVYETDEYKQIAYPSVEGILLADARFSWSDGITDMALKLTDEEKEALVVAYQKDVGNMKMDDLAKVLPLGFVDIDSETLHLSGEIVVYPFFTYTCGLLEKYDVPIYKKLSDYPVRSISVSSVSVNSMGKRESKYYDEPEEIEEWKQKAVPKKFDLQPFLCPLDYSQEIRAEVIDVTTNSTVYVNCYSKRN